MPKAHFLGSKLAAPPSCFSRCRDFLPVARALWQRECHAAAARARRPTPAAAEGEAARLNCGGLRWWTEAVVPPEVSSRARWPTRNVSVALDRLRVCATPGRLGGQRLCEDL